MGLDMYLYARRPAPGLDTEGMRFTDYGGTREASLWGSELASENERALYRRAVEAAGLTEITDLGSTSAHVYEGNPPLVDATVVYWRKANQIHAWFVEHVQDGVDECQLSPVSREQLAELVETCETVLRAMKDGDRAKAAELLPPSYGFFFGRVEIDEFYVRDLEHTRDRLTAVLLATQNTEVDFLYRSSW